MQIRLSHAADAQAIRHVHLRAFPTRAEADLVDQLVADGDAAVSIVAEDDGIVGHVLLSRMNVVADGEVLDALGLAPIAVVPERQGERIGSALVEAAVQQARSAGAHILFLLGEPEFYGRFGFTAEAAKPFESPYAGSYFQALALTDLPPVRSGSASYARAFDNLG
ncbi:MAG: GNAT family N-acetyltransferase [Sphingomicrobium sp.]